MTFKEFTDLVLQHLDQYSVSGELIPKDYNNQEDYTNRIAPLANIALRTIATQAEPLIGTFDANTKGVEMHDLANGLTRIKMPSDFYRMTGNGLPTFQGDVDFARNMNYRHLTPNEILVRTADLPSLVITYYRYPRTVHGHASEVLDASESASDCASFYVAAQLARYDNPYAYQSLYNEFETMMTRLKKPISTESSEALDVYRFF